MAGTSPAMTEKRINFKLLAEARKCWLLFWSGSEEPRSAWRLEGRDAARMIFLASAMQPKRFCCTLSGQQTPLVSPQNRAQPVVA
jgi:hypothetical protein